MRKLLFFAASSAIVFAGCTKEFAEQRVLGEAVITATASAPGSTQDTRIAYNDGYSEEEPQIDITAAWESGDSFKALEINGETVTPVTFTTSGSGATASFTSTGAVEANANTTWVAVLGDVTVDESNNFVCKYDGQDGSLKNLGKYDYTVVYANGASPEFKFAEEGTKLSYIMRVKLPAGIKYIEYNTGVKNNGGWSVTSAGSAKPTVSTCEKAAVSTASLVSVGKKGSLAYIAIPAIDYSVGDGDSKNRLGGLIMTVMSLDKKSSQGAVMSNNLSKKGGKVGTYDMSNMELMARPLPSEAIKLGSVKYGTKTYTLGSWAPFNMGADDKTIEGGLYAWGEIEPKTSFSQANYKYYNSGTYLTQLGTKYTVVMEGVGTFVEYYPSAVSKYISGPGTFYDIRGTKYDVARVKWGSEWCLPSNDIACNVIKCGDNHLKDSIDVQKLVDVQYVDKGVKSQNYAAVVVKAKVTGGELVLYATPYTSQGSKDTGGTMTRYWTATTDYGNNNDATSKWWNRAIQFRIQDKWILINNHSWIWDGLSVRAVLNE